MSDYTRRYVIPNSTNNGLKIILKSYLSDIFYDSLKIKKSFEIGRKGFKFFHHIFFLCKQKIQRILVMNASSARNRFKTEFSGHIQKKMVDGTI